MILRFQDLDYKAITPTPDTPELADTGRRLMFRHNGGQHGEPEFFIAREGEMYAGWVIGVDVGRRA